MNLFEAVKDAVPARTAAQHYGIEVGRNGMARCPFHDDKTPSMKLDKRFHCFGCQEDGDVIDLVGKLFDLSPKRAAEKIAEDFGVRHDGLKAWDAHGRPSVISKLEAAQKYREKERRCHDVLCQYSRLLRDWKGRYAPLATDEDLHPLFVEALQKADYVEYLLDELRCASLEERPRIVNEIETMVDALEKRIADCSGARAAAWENDKVISGECTKTMGKRISGELAM